MTQYVTNRIIDYFCTSGLKKLINFNSEQREEKFLTNLELFYGIIDKDMDTGYVEGKIVNTNKNGEVWLDLIGDRTLWLKCTYNEKQKKPISQVDFFYFHQNSIEEDAEGKFPIPIQQINNNLSSKNGNKLQHEYDLVPYLQAQKYEDYCLVLTFKRQRDLVKENAISVIDIAIGQKNKKKIHGDITYVIPNQFQALKSLISFGEPNKNRIIIVKQRKSFLMQQFAPQIIDKYPHKNHGYYEFNNDVALMCFPQGIRFHIQDQSPQAFSFVLTNEKQESIYCTTLVFTEIAQTDILKQIEQMYKISSQGNQLYQEKAICLVSHYDYFFEQKELLKYIYRFHLAKNSIRLEQVISKILGKLQFKENLQHILHKNQCVSLDLGNCVLNFRQNVNYQHFDEESIKVLMMVFDTDKIISLVQCILLEKQIYLISKQKSLITQVSSALLSLTYPMQWLYPWIPILSDAMKQGQQAPVPFIIGIDQNDPDHQQGLQSDTISAYIDTNDLLNIESIPKLPEKIYKTLYKKLQKYDKMRNEQRHYINEFIEKSDECFYKVYLDGFQFDLNYDSYVVKDAFFEFMCSLIHNYFYYVHYDSQSNNGQFQMCNDILDVKKYLAYHKAQPQGFLQTYIEKSASFSYFIEQRYFQDSDNIMYEFIDKCIKQKRSKGQLFISIDYNCYNEVINFKQEENQNQVYSYNYFPKLDSQYMIKEENEFLDKSLELSQSKMKIMVQEERLKYEYFTQLRSQGKKGMNKLLDEIYYLWFIVSFSFIKEFSTIRTDSDQNHGANSINNSQFNNSNSNSSNQNQTQYNQNEEEKNNNNNSYFINKKNNQNEFHQSDKEQFLILLNDIQIFMLRKLIIDGYINEDKEKYFLCTIESAGYLGFHNLIEELYKDMVQGDKHFACQPKYNSVYFKANKNAFQKNNQENKVDIQRIVKKIEGSIDYVEFEKKYFFRFENCQQCQKKITFDYLVVGENLEKDNSYFCQCIFSNNQQFQEIKIDVIQLGTEFNEAKNKYQRESSFYLVSPQFLADQVKKKGLMKTLLDKNLNNFLQNILFYSELINLPSYFIEYYNNFLSVQLQKKNQINQNNSYNINIQSKQKQMECLLNDKIQEFKNLLETLKRGKGLSQSTIQGVNGISPGKKQDSLSKIRYFFQKSKVKLGTQDMYQIYSQIQDQFQQKVDDKIKQFEEDMNNIDEQTNKIQLLGNINKHQNDLNQKSSLNNIKENIFVDQSDNKNQNCNTNENIISNSHKLYQQQQQIQATVQMQQNQIQMEMQVPEQNF